ncbi:MAG: alpha/beta fold hydrolase [Candidatus Omnitrophica bacterium]|nr:alpha/beta fold hydrolase [Candidatus Omnitrophota bacterium]
MKKLTLTTIDKHRIAAVHYERGAGKAVVLAHGFFNNKEVALFDGIAQALAVEYDVFSFDFRGHGKSSGLFSWTSREGADLQAMLAYVKSLHYQSIGLVGFSLGAALSLIEAARDPDIKTVVAVSAPYDFWQIDFNFWKPGMLADLKLNLGVKGRGKGVWPGNPFEPKVAPITIVGKIAPRPVLFVHGSEDWLINVRHSRELFRKAGEPKKLVIMEGGGHAEKLFDDHPDEFVKTILDWLKETL